MTRCEGVKWGRVTWWCAHNEMGEVQGHIRWQESSIGAKMLSPHCILSPHICPPRIVLEVRGQFEVGGRMGGVDKSQGALS